MTTSSHPPESRSHRHLFPRRPRLPTFPKWLPSPFRPSLPPAAPPWLNGRVSVHDRQQIELSWTYPSSAKLNSNYRIDVFFFLPYAIGLSSETYDPAAFFSDTQAYIRLATPKVPLNQLLDKLAPSPLSELSSILKSGTDSATTILHAKLAGSVLRTSIRRQRRKLLQLILTPDAFSKRISDRSRDFCSNTAALLNRFRELRSSAPTDRVANCLSLIDDALSGVVLEATCDAIHALENRVDFTEESLSELVAFLKQEIQYRNQNHWLTLSTESTSVDLETLMHRRSQLKKYIFGALYLRVRGLRSQTLFQHLFSSVGACLAATFAFFSNPALFGSVTINSLTFAVLFVAVFAYILKDRIKELTKQYLAGRFRKWLPDRDREVLPSDLMPPPHLPIGRVKEYINFVPPSKVDPDIHQIRNAVHTIELGEDASESILHYGKVINLKPRSDGPCAREGIKDILRFNVGHFLTRLDESLDTIYAFDPATKRSQQIEGGHVYHVNVVMRHVAFNDDGKPGKPTLERIRLVLQKSGVLRVEPVILDAAQEQADEENTPEDTD